MGVVVQIPSEDEKPQKDSFEPDITFILPRKTTTVKLWPSKLKPMWSRTYQSSCLPFTQIAQTSQTVYRTPGLLEPSVYECKWTSWLSLTLILKLKDKIGKNVIGLMTSVTRLLALCGSLCCLLAFSMSTLCLGKSHWPRFMSNGQSLDDPWMIQSWTYELSCSRSRLKVQHLLLQQKYYCNQFSVQQILSTSGSPCIPNPNKQAIQTVTPQSEVEISTTTRSLTEKIGQIERLFLMGNGFFMLDTIFS